MIQVATQYGTEWQWVRGVIHTSSSCVISWVFSVSHWSLAITADDISRLFTSIFSDTTVHHIHKLNIWSNSTSTTADKNYLYLVFKVPIWGSTNCVWSEGFCHSMGGPYHLSQSYYSPITKLYNAQDRNTEPTSTSSTNETKEQHSGKN